MAIKDMINNDNGNTILMVTPAMLQEFAVRLIQEASDKLRKEEEPTFTPAEFAARWRVDKSTLWRWVKEGKLKKTTIGKKTFYRDSDLRKEA